jgi:hydrogenase maturation protease
VSGTLIGGIGNVFLGDDGFGVEVVRRLADRPRHEDVHIADFGIRSIDLAYALLDDYDDVILVDAMPRGEPPGTLYVVEPSSEERQSRQGPTAGLAAHGLVPTQAFALAAALGGDGTAAKRVRIVGCEPAVIPPDGDVIVGLSAPVAAAVERALDLVQELVEERPRHA